MKIDHINIVVSDLKQSSDFFQILGFTIEDEALLKGEWISKVVGFPDTEARYIKMKLPDDTIFLELIEYYNPVGAKDPDIGKPNQVGFRHIAFNVRNIESLTEKLEEANIELFSDIQVFPKTGKKIIYFKGPDDIILELAEYKT
ncbi:MAG: VOC family protein [Alphaproteobacteria bacterium]|nr:VOC family protein [Alphaproteobacteria bacterium]